ncbi:MAG: DUF4430 domain-containing protein [Clostridiales bacterium]|nr:DUF4430 domain-containing protein [Candidatus Equinaster intestinalis]
MKKTICLLTSIIMIFCFVSCKKAEETGDIWNNATYTENTAFGSGKTQIELEVKAGDKSVTFTIKTDKTTLADALDGAGLIPAGTGEYIKTLNGMTADYDIDKSYWSLSKNGEYLMTGATDTNIANGEHYEFTHTK